MSVSRSLTPYLILGVLALVVGLGAALGVAEGPVTFPAMAAAEMTCTTTVIGDAATVQCRSAHSSLTHFFVFPKKNIRKKFASCMTNALDRARPETLAAGIRVINSNLATCKY
jgi:hypothetical protein